MHGASRLTSKKRKRILPDMPQRVETGYVQWQSDCHFCNSVKRDQTVADPFRFLRATLATTLPDGSLRPHDRETQRLIRQLDLNSPRLKSWRVMWIRIVDLANDRDTGLYFQLVGFPE